MKTTMKTTDLTLLKGADTILMGEGWIDAGIALNEAIAELQALRELVSSSKPVCPHCSAGMKPTKYVGFYEGFDYWNCDCDDLPTVKTWKGGYA